MTIADYIENINRRYLQGNATEHTFRGDLQQLIESLVPTVSATNEPKRQKCGAPDYILTKKDIPVGFIEAKDLGDKDLAGEKKTGNKEQFDRYKASLGNIIFTDYLSFYYYKDGEFVTKITIAGISDKGITSLPENFDAFSLLLKGFCDTVSQTIGSPKKLAEMMANKARLLAEVIEKALLSDKAGQENSTLHDQLEAFKQILIHDITPKAFADVYAQTIAYGMFAARYHDPTLPTFSRQEAAELIPKSNPFLRKLFQYIAGYDLDDRIKWIVDNLVDIFLACDVVELLQGFGKETRQEDPIIHFYETFLAEYDPALRKARGVWYTPQPVVNFIVRAVDEVLKTEFGLPAGIADNSKTTIKIDQKGKKVDTDVHKVQILDPATGTGTFLAETIKQIYGRFKDQKGIWPGYVEQHLLPRINGFELLMASYAMAHLQLDLLLKETGANIAKDQRVRVFLTNSLEEYHPETGSLFANWLSAEANEANRVKRDSPVMVVMGNPPYSVSSSNKSPWIEKLLVDYKKDLNEKNIQPLSDDYIKFIRFGQHFIDKNGTGVLAYISNNSFIDGMIHRQMRKHLLESFDKIYILDLHGNAKRKETAADGGADQNVFDIQQGVSINIFIKTGKNKKEGLAKVFHYDLQGKRDFKYKFLSSNQLKSVVWDELVLQSPDYFFVKKDFAAEEEYRQGFKIDELFVVNSSGIKTHRDEFVMDMDSKPLMSRIEKFYDKRFSDDQIKTAFKLENNRDWQAEIVRKSGKFKKELIKKVLYRPFDTRFIYYDKNLIDFAKVNIMQHLLNGNNYGIVLPKQTPNSESSGGFVTNKICDHKSFSAYNTNTVFPLYLYPSSVAKSEISLVNEDGSTYGDNRKPNLQPEIVAKLAEGLQLRFTPEKTKEAGTFAPIDVLDYIYAVLHSPKYRETYKEFLKIDFPRAPYPKDAAAFWRLVALGGRLRALHVLESPEVEPFITKYPEEGDNTVKKPVYKGQRVYINDAQYFDQVPQEVWEFYIGGYQPAQKWLKDRQGRALDFDDIQHYQRMIVALWQTHQIMQNIDEKDIIGGG